METPTAIPIFFELSFESLDEIPPPPLFFDVELLFVDELF
jgi:hypothetical protein